MKNKNIWMYMFFGLLIVFVITSILLLQKKSQSDLLTYKEKYVSMRQAYINLAKSQSFTFEVLLKNPDLQSMMPEYRDRSKDEFLEAVRRKIVELKIKVENLEKER